MANMLTDPSTETEFAYQITENIVQYSSNKWELGFTEEDLHIFGVSSTKYNSKDLRDPRVLVNIILMMD